MRCTHPVLLKDLPFPVPCNRCIACRINKLTEWTTRLYMELPYHDESCYVTLTYDPEFEPPDRSIHKEDLQLFYKRLRKKFGEGIKYFSCGEYGSEENTFRPHYHAIIFGVNFPDWRRIGFRNGRPVFTSDLLASIWQHGFVTIDSVNETDINYVTGYIRKKMYGKDAQIYKDRGVIPPFQLFSKSLGLRYIHDYGDQLRQNGFVWRNGKKVPLPRYAAKKLGLTDVDEFGHSQLYYKAQETIQKRLDQFSKFEFPTDPYRQDQGLEVEYAYYDYDVRMQRELELRSHEPERNQI